MKKLLKGLLSLSLAACFVFTSIPVSAANTLTYTLPAHPPQHDYYEKAFSTTYEFRDIFLAQHGSDRAIIYDMIAGVMLDILYDDTLGYDKEISVRGFERIADVHEFGAAMLAVKKDMPFLEAFLLTSGGGGIERLPCYCHKVSVQLSLGNQQHNELLLRTTPDRQQKLYSHEGQGCKRTE